MPSSVILAMRYEPVREELLIVFRGKGVAYRYFDVPMQEWEAFLDAESKGTYLNRVFKAKKHPYERWDEEVRLSDENPAERRWVWGEAGASRKQPGRIEASSGVAKIRA